jgi:hypothetical protein
MSNRGQQRRQLQQQVRITNRVRQGWRRCTPTATKAHKIKFNPAAIKLTRKQHTHGGPTDFHGAALEMSVAIWRLLWLPRWRSPHLHLRLRQAVR